mmetsp:Transcript_3421/g.7477  ORF Transcript_3421/g.7477 Transcript_3421/m.7477 type:complete len:408 (-) Transcript_3421:64-1287(-)
MPSSSESSESADTNSTAVCRVVIIGAQRARVAKVASILNSDQALANFQHQPPDYEDQTPAINITIEYLPCVATFGSYKNASGDVVRYLEKIEYHGAEGGCPRGSSLAPFFDTVDDAEVNQKLRLDGISVVAIGCGIDSTQDVAMIETFVNGVCSASVEDGHSSIDAPILQCVQPNGEYSSMKEENEAYRGMSADEKSEAVQSGTIGPGKMARFAYALAEGVIENAIESAFPKQEKVYIEQDAKAEKEDDGSEVGEDASALTVVQEPVVRMRDPSKVQFACRICRAILFDEDDLENPPHSRSSHSFSRKHDKPDGRGGAGQCESQFLSGGMDWMGDIGGMEGKLHCPKCHSKLGLWKWAGAQCSCGTWVTPAIQIPNSKVDELLAPPVAVSAGGLIPGLSSLAVQPKP